MVSGSVGRLRLTLAVLTVACGWVAGPNPVAAAAPPVLERWADSELPVQGGLVVWLDAARQPAAYAARALPTPRPGQAVGAWFDGSGNHRDFVQRRGDAQPTFQAPGGHPLLRFDGENDALERTGFGGPYRALTVFLVAAPRANAGMFRGLFALNATGLRDYVSGVNIDLGPLPSRRFDTLNVEGAGCGGALDLLRTTSDFGRVAILEVALGSGNGAVRVSRNGSIEGQRDRRDEPILAEEATLGARCYSNEPRPNYVQGFLAGDLIEVLVYDRVLDARESARVHDYLTTKHEALRSRLAAASEADATEPPPFQMLVPGFSVRELPVRLHNVNNVRYRPDGTLVALTYRGDILLLTDRDGDGLEEHVETFWENRGRLRGPIGMALTPPGHAPGPGVYVASKGRCSLILDTNGDDRADREIIVAEGWKEISQAVDALGVARAPDGRIFFGLGTADFTNAYLLDGQGKSHYDLGSERGTILEVSPDFQKRSIIATGVRFPVGLAFNAEGDLFCSDQEGATWLPNGNPFDELLHIRPGRHYGFPPRHATHLPRVVDEPSTFDYRPQHQSTCGLVFNEPVVPASATFGPSWWRGNALVCGYSRGKLYRTELVKSRGTYVARNETIGLATTLVVDACVAPEGSLVVASHGGLPDWGSGPEGTGHLFKISSTDPAAPQPVMTWSSGPREVRVAFDRPVEPDRIGEVSRRASIVGGVAVSAGDRLESNRPGYAVVAAQLAAPRTRFPVRAVALTPDRRTFRIETDPLALPFDYALTLHGLARPAPGPDPLNALRQEPAIDLGFDLSGVAASWSTPDGNVKWEGWLPHLDLDTARGFTMQSAEHEAFRAALERPGRMVLRTRLDLAHLLRPAVQPGSKLDDELPPETATLVFRASGALAVRSGSTQGTVIPEAGTGQRVELSLVAPDGRFVDLEVTLATGPATRLDVDFHTNDDARTRPLALRRFHVPWAADPGASAVTLARVVPPELRGGNRERGRALFQGDVALCARCHAVRGEGGRIGPDLTNLIERDYASVVRDIRRPSEVLNPDYIPYTVALSDGRVLQGTLRTEGANLRIGGSDGRETLVPRAEVEELKASSTSVMPEGLAEKLGPEGLRDLLTFLLTPEK
ncbi:MAG: PQQ-dependent sugar dehydrogenase [Isosphaeraceae bacterium]